MLVALAASSSPLSAWARALASSSRSANPVPPVADAAKASVWKISASSGLTPIEENWRA